MLLAIWLTAICLETVLLALTWRRKDSFWFVVWIFAKLLANLVEFSLGQSAMYDLVWRGSEMICFVIACFAVAETVREMRIVRKSLTIMLAAGASIAIHILLRYPYRWPGNYLEAVYSFLALGNLILGLFLVQQCVSEDCTQRTGIFMLYLLSTAACFYSASAYPLIIGQPLMAVELAAMLGWIAIFHNRTLRV